MLAAVAQVLTATETATPTRIVVDSVVRVAAVMAALLAPGTLAAQVVEALTQVVVVVVVHTPLHWVQQTELLEVLGL